MHLQALSVLQQYNSNLEAFTQGALILILAVAIVTSNALIIATIVNFRGKFKRPHHSTMSTVLRSRQKSVWKINFRINENSKSKLIQFVPRQLTYQSYCVIKFVTVIGTRIPPRTAHRTHNDITMWNIHATFPSHPLGARWRIFHFSNGLTDVKSQPSGMGKMCCLGERGNARIFDCERIDQPIITDFDKLICWVTANVMQFYWKNKHCFVCADERYGYVPVPYGGNANAKCHKQLQGDVTHSYRHQHHVRLHPSHARRKSIQINYIQMRRQCGKACEYPIHLMDCKKKEGKLDTVPMKATMFGQ